jgi:glutathione-regulated potassium-efflux system protein KefB
MAAPESTNELIQVVALLGAGVAAAPVFLRLGLGSVLGYLAAGLAIGPFGLGLFTNPQAILHVAELGVVMFLFVIGLEMQPSRLWSLRREIFGLGLAQVLACGLILTGVGIGFGLDPKVAFFAAMGFVLTSTAVVIQILNERGDVATAEGQRMVSILLLEDLAIVPLLALVVLLAPPGASDAHESPWLAAAIAVGAVAALLAAGRWLLNPFFRLLAAAQAREVMTAAALLVVLGSALIMQVSGLSMAMGAFLAGVLLSESTFRHQLEADVEPFRGILLGLFFLSVGMSLDLSVIRTDWRIILMGVPAYMAAKAAAIYLVARLFKAPHREALYRSALFAQGGEFAFVLYSAAASAGILTGRVNAILTAIVIISMALTPIGVLALRLLPARRQSFAGVEEPHDLSANMLIVGFGRFGQVASQSFLARGLDVTIVDIDTDMIRSAAEFGFKVYYGDGTRLDLLEASGAGKAKLIAVCVDNRATATRIAEIVMERFPQTRLMVRSYDREHALELVHKGIDTQIRETFESAMMFGEIGLRTLGVPDAEAAEIVDEIRRRDAERFALEIAGGIGAGVDMLHGNLPKPTPLTKPKRAGQVMGQRPPVDEV